MNFCLASRSITLRPDSPTSPVKFPTCGPAMPLLQFSPLRLGIAAGWRRLLAWLDSIGLEANMRGWPGSTCFVLSG